MSSQQEQRTEVHQLRDMMRGITMAYNTQEQVLAVLRCQVRDTPYHIMEDFAQIMEGNLEQFRGQVKGCLVLIEEVV